MQIRRFSHVLAMSMAPAFGMASLASAQPFSFEKVIDNTSAALDTFGVPHLNDVGQVVFHGQKDGVSGVYVGGVGVTPQRVVDDADPMFDTFDAFPFINNSGTVVTWAQNTAADQQFVISGQAGGSINIIAQTNGTFDRLGAAPSINDSGVVAFLGRKEGDPDFVSINTRLYPDPIAALEDTSGAFSNFFIPLINNQGAISFLAVDDEKAAVYRRDNDGTRTLIADNTGEFSGVLPYSAPNVHGQVAVHARRPAGSASRWAIVLGDGTSLVTLVEAADHGFADSVFDLEINDNGLIAFSPRLETDSSLALYFHGDGDLHKVLQRGDPLFGDTVQDIFFARGLNQNNEVAFLYVLNNGEFGIATTVIPEPAGMALMMVAAPLLLRRRDVTKTG